MGAFVSPLTGFLDAANTTFAKKFTNNTLYADLIAPRVEHPFQSGKYWIFDRANQELLQQTKRATGAGAQRMRRKLSTASLYITSHALSAVIPDEDRLNYQAGDLETQSVADLMDKILLDKEVELATMLTDTAQVTNNATKSTTGQWSDLANSTPITDVETAKATIRLAGVLPNFMIVGDAVYQQLINHPSVVERFKYTQGGVVTPQQLATLFGVDNFYVGSGVQVDKAGTATFVWGKNAVIGYVSPTPSFQDTSGAKTFVWSAAPGTLGGIGVIRARDPEPTAKSDIIGVDFYHGQAITAVETLYLIKNAVA
jgi:hypothetical protein